MPPSNQQRWREVAQVLLAEADRIDAPETRAEKLVEVGDLYREAGVAAQASEYYFQAVAVCPEAPQQPLSRLARMARETGDVAVTANLVAGLSHAGHWADVVTVLARQAEVVDDPSERTGLLLEAGRIAELRLADPERARQFVLDAARGADAGGAEVVLKRLRSHLQAAPADEQAAQAAARLLVASDRHREAVETLSAAAVHATDYALKAGLRFDASVICADRLDKPVEAVKHLYDALVLDPERADAVYARLLSIQGRWAQVPAVAESLRNVYESLQQPERVHTLLAAQVRLAEDPDAAGQAQLELAEHAEYQLLDGPRAFALYRAGLEGGAGPLAGFAAGMRRVGAEGVDGAFEVMTELFERLGLWRALVQVLDDQAALTVEDEDRAALAHRAGQVLETRLDDLDGAMERYLSAFRLASRHPEYISAGERIYRRRGDWRMVDRLLGLQAQVTADPAARGAIQLDQAQVRHRELGQIMPAYDLLVALVADDVAGARPALDGLVRDDDAFAEIERTLRRRADEEGQTAAAVLLLELAALSLEVRQDPAGALGPLREAADLTPDDPALFEQVAALLAGLEDPVAEAAWLANTRATLAPDRRVAVLRRAATLYAAAGMHVEARDALLNALQLSPTDDELVAAALDAARAVDDPGLLGALIDEVLNGGVGAAPPADAARIALLHELAEARLAQGDGAAAVEVYGTILAEAPLDPQALKFLREWYRERKAWDALRGVIEAAADARRAAEGAPAVDLLEALAELAEQELDDLRLAAVYVEQLARVPGKRIYARAELHRLYAAAGDREGRLGLLGLELEDAHEKKREKLARELLALAEAPPVEVAAQRRALEVLVELDPQDTDRLDALAAVLRDGDDVPALLDVLARRVALDPGEGSADALQERAELLQDVVEDLDGAADAWRRLIALRPSDDARASLQRAEAHRGDFEAVHALLLERAEALADDPERRARLLREASVVAEVQLGAPARAIADQQAVLALGLDPVETRAELLRLYEVVEDWPALVEMGEASLPDLAPADRVPLLRTLARACTTQLARPEAATRHWQALHAAAPEDAEALRALVAAAEAAADGATLVTLLDGLAAVEDTPAARQDVLRRRARALSDQGDAAAALAAWQAVRAEAGDDREGLRAVRELASAVGDHEAVAEAMEAELAQVKTVPARIGLLKALAEVRANALRDLDGAIECWERVRAEDPADDGALIALKRLYAEARRTPDLVRILRVLLKQAGDDQVKVARLVDAAGLIERLDGDPGEVYECWWRAFHLSPGIDEEKLDHLRRLARAHGYWPQLQEALAFARGRAEGQAQRRALLIEQATLVAEHGSPSAAFGLYEEAFDADPTPGPVLDALTRLAEPAGAWARLVAAVRRAADGSSDAHERAGLLIRGAELTEAYLADPAAAFRMYADSLTARARPEIRERMLALVEREDLWDDLTDWYGRRWQGQSLLSGKLETLHEYASLLESRTEDWERAFEQYLLALQLSPRDEATRAAVWRLAEAHRCWPLVARVLRLKAEEADEAWLKAALLRDLAGLQAEHMGQREQAFETLRRAFAAKPFDEETVLALRAEAEAQRRWRELAAFFEEEAGWAGDRHLRVRLLREAAELLQRNGEPAEAARILARVVEVDRKDVATVDRLLDLLREAGDPAALAAALEAHSRGDDEARQVTLMAELAALYAGPLAAPGRAQRVLERLVKLRPDDDAFFHALTDSLEQQGDWAGLSEALDRRIRRASGEAKLALLRERAEVLVRHLEQPKPAFRLLVQVARAVPEDQELLFDLARRAAELGTFEDVLSCAERTAEVADPDRLGDVLVLIGRVARDRFRNDKKALQALSRAQQLRPEDRVLAREVAALLKRRKRFRELIELYQSFGPGILLDHERDPSLEDEARWALEVAALLAEKQYRFDAAAEAVEQLLLRQPAHLGALERLVALAERAKDWGRLETATLRLVDELPASRQVRQLTLAASELATVGAHERAARLWQRVLTIEPEHEDARRELGRWAEKQRDWDLLAEQASARAETSRGPEERAKVLFELGLLQRDHREDLDAAWAAFTGAIEAVPSHEEALMATVELARLRGDDAGLARYGERLTQRLEQRTDAAARARLAPVAGRFLLDQAALQSEPERTATLERAWRCAPAEPAVARAYADMLYAQGRLEEAAHVYAELRPLTSRETPAVQAAANLRRAESFRAAGMDERALRCFEAAALAPDTRVAALGALAEMHTQAERWEAAARVEEKLAETCPPGAPRARALATAGRICEARLGKPRRASALYVRAVKEGLDDPGLLRDVLDALLEQGEDEVADTVVDRLLARQTDPNHRAELLCARGAIRERSGDTTTAHAAFRRALEESPLLTPAVEGVLSTLSVASEAEQTRLLRLIRDAASGADRRVRGPVLEKLGAALLERQDTPGALEVFEALHAVDRGHVGAQAALADLYGQLVAGGVDEDVQPHLQRAIGHRLAYLRARPAEPQALRDLFALYQLAGHATGAVLVMRLLTLLGEARPDERQWLSTQPAQRHGVPDVVLDASSRHELVADDEWRQPVALLLRTLHAWIAPALDAQFHSQREAQPADVLDPPVAELADALAGALQVPERRWWITPDMGRVVGLVRLHPPELVVGAGLGREYPGPERCFVVARALELTRGPAVFACYLPDVEARAIFAATILAALPRQTSFAEACGAKRDRVRYWREFLVNTLSEEQLRGLAQHAGPVVASGAAAFDDWAAAVRRTANRVGLVMCGDLIRSISILVRETPSLANMVLDDVRAFRELLAASPEIADLYNYAFSQRLYDLRTGLRLDLD